MECLLRALNSPPCPVHPLHPCTQSGDASKVKETLHLKDKKINELVEELGSTTLLLTAAQAQIAGSATAQKELAELREMKEDVERREKAQAEVISNQAKKLDDLDKKYREESVMRKKIYNQVRGVGSAGRGAGGLGTLGGGHTCRAAGPVLADTSAESTESLTTLPATRPAHRWRT